MRRTIFTGFAPNASKDDVRSAVSFLLPWQWGGWRNGTAPEQVELWFKEYFSVSHAYTFDSGRSALYFALKALGVGEGDDVLVQAYTCVVVSNAIRWTGATPVYIDVDESLNMDPEDLRKKITPNSKAVIVQHTFGAPADMDSIASVIKESNIKLVEDCAHALGAEYKGKKVGTMGDVAMFSFGSDKIVSSARGGIAMTNNAEIGKKLENYSRELAPMSRVHIFRHLMTYPLFFAGRSLYHVGIGKLLLVLAKKTRLMSRIIDPAEKQGKQTGWFPCAFPNALATLALGQLEQLETFQTHRMTLAAVYARELGNVYEAQATPHGSVHLRYTLFSPRAKEIRAQAKAQGILLGEWYNTVIAPSDADEQVAQYTKGSCPRAEYYADRSVNLPTNPNTSQKEAEKVISCLTSIHNSLS